MTVECALREPRLAWRMAAQKARRVTGLFAALSLTLSSLCASSGRDRATQPNLYRTRKRAWFWYRCDIYPDIVKPPALVTNPLKPSAGEVEYQGLAECRNVKLN